MTDFSRLEDKLTKLGQRATPGPRRLSGASPDALLARIATEVDEVILPRTLTFTPDTGEPILITVANRRIQALIAPATGALADLAGNVLGSGDEATLSNLKTGLLEALDGARTLTVNAKRPDADATFGAESGVPISVLARHWGISLEASGATGADPTDAMVAFLADATGRARAWLSIDGEDVSDSGGDDALVARLGEHLGGWLDSYLQKRDSLAIADGTAVCLVIGAAGDAGTVLMADHGGMKAVMLVDAAAIGDVTSAWQGALGL